MQRSCIEAQILPHVTSNTTAVSISITSKNIISWKVYFWIGYNMVKFWFCYPNYSSFSLIDNASYFIFFWKSTVNVYMQKCKPFLLSGSHTVEFISRYLWTVPRFRVEFISGDFWIGPGFRLTSPDNNKRNL